MSDESHDEWEATRRGSIFSEPACAPYPRPDDVVAPVIPATACPGCAALAKIEPVIRSVRGGHLGLAALDAVIERIELAAQGTGHEPPPSALREHAATIGATAGEPLIPAAKLRERIKKLRSEYDDAAGLMWNGALDAVVEHLAAIEDEQTGHGR